MRQDLLGIGVKAAHLLVRRLREPGASPEHLRLPAELVVRESTARPPELEIAKEVRPSLQRSKTDSTGSR